MGRTCEVVESREAYSDESLVWWVHRGWPARCGLADRETRGVFMLVFYSLQSMLHISVPSGLRVLMTNSRSDIQFEGWVLNGRCVCGLEVGTNDGSEYMSSRYYTRPSDSSLRLL